MKGEIEVAIETTREYLKEESPIDLCCGLLGRLEFLYQAGIELQRLDLQKLVKKTFSSILLARKKREGNAFFYPSLMKGEAGLGYALLRQIDRNRILPNLLVLD